MQVYRQVAALFDRLLNADDVREDLTLVVRCAARKHVPILQDRLERRRVPELKRVGRLHIVMPVDQTCATSGLMFIVRPDDWVSSRANELRLQPDARELLNEPICTLLQLFFVPVIGRNTWKSQKRIELLKIVL